MKLFFFGVPTLVPDSICVWVCPLDCPGAPLQQDYCDSPESYSLGEGRFDSFEKVATMEYKPILFGKANLPNIVKYLIT